MIFVGIAAGTLGFLQTIDIEHIPALVDSLEQQTYSYIKAPLLAARIVGQSKALGHAFNEITIEHAGPYEARLNLYIDDAVGHFAGDGLIFATPLGSTAYSLAAGGPMIDARAENLFVITPSNPHITRIYSSLHRPYVVDKGRRVIVDVTADDRVDRPAKLSVDGHEVIARITQPVEIFMTRHDVKLLQITTGGFHSRIDAKRLGGF